MRSSPYSVTAFKIKRVVYFAWNMRAQLHTVRSWLVCFLSSIFLSSFFSLVAMTSLTLRFMQCDADQSYCMQLRQPVSSRSHMCQSCWNNLNSSTKHCRCGSMLREFSWIRLESSCSLLIKWRPTPWSVCRAIYCSTKHVLGRQPRKDLIRGTEWTKAIVCVLLTYCSQCTMIVLQLVMYSRSFVYYFVVVEPWLSWFVTGNTLWIFLWCSRRYRPSQ